MKNVFGLITLESINDLELFEICKKAPYMEYCGVDDSETTEAMGYYFYDVDGWIEDLDRNKPKYFIKFLSKEQEDLAFELLNDWIY